jgi:Alternative complex III, ActD subunit
MSDLNRDYGVMVEFESPSLLVEAVEKVRDKGFKKWDVHTPFPIHGMDEAMGIRGTQLPFIVLACGATGLGLAVLMQWWMNAIDYPFIISGKPLFGLPAAVPIMFELTVLLSAFGCFFGMWGLNGMPRLHHPLFSSKRFRRATQDRFFIVIETADPQYDSISTPAFLESLGGMSIETINESAED